MSLDWHKFFILPLHTLRISISGLYSKYMPNFLRCYQSVLQGSCAILHFTNSVHKFNLHVLKSLKISGFLYHLYVYFQTCFLTISSCLSLITAQQHKFPLQISILCFIYGTSVSLLWSNTFKQWFVNSVKIVFNLICSLNLSGLVKLLFFPNGYFSLMDTAHISSSHCRLLYFSTVPS